MFGHPDHPPETGSEMLRRVLSRACLEATNYPERPLIGFEGAWIKALHRAFAAENPDLTILSHGEGPDTNNTALYGRREFLYDMVAAELGVTTKTPGKGAPVTIIGRPVWLVESEFDVNSKLVAHDLGKLVFGSAPYKLLITQTRRGNPPVAFNRFVHEASHHCDGTLFLAYTPHPSGWSSYQPVIADVWVRGANTMERLPWSPLTIKQSLAAAGSPAA